MLKPPFHGIFGGSNRVVYYLIKGPDAEPAAFIGAHWALQAPSLATGIRCQETFVAEGECLNRQD